MALDEVLELAAALDAVAARGRELHCRAREAGVPLEDPEAAGQMLAGLEVAARLMRLRPEAFYADDRLTQMLALATADLDALEGKLRDAALSKS